MQIRKRNGQEVEFDKSKIQSALTRANSNMTKESDKLDQSSILDITNLITDELQKLERIPDVEDIQDMVQKELCQRNKDKLFEEYAVYRFKHAEDRRQKSLYSKCLSIVNNDNNEIMGDNLNKNPLRLSTQRDYLAGTISKEIYSDVLLPKDISEAHREGIIHQHDADYSIQHMNNCCLVDIIDMLWNSTIISDTLIERPHLFSTACNITTQIISQVASSQFGGQSISLAHLVPFVDMSREHFRNDIKNEAKNAGIEYSDEQIEKIVETRIKKEINRGIQTIQYQLETLMTTNGQTPFITLAMFRNDIEDVAEFCRLKNIDRLHKDFNLLVEEVLNQRIDGIKGTDGHIISPVFPKLIYCIDSTCCEEGTPNWYLTELASKCTLARMVPDYVSEKIMIRLRGLKPHDAELREKFGIDYLGNVVDEQKFNDSILDKNLHDDLLVCSALDLMGINYADACFSSMGCLGYHEKIDLEGSENNDIGFVAELITDLYDCKMYIDDFRNDNTKEAEFAIFKLRRADNGNINVIVDDKLIFKDVSFIFDTKKTSNESYTKYEFPDNSLRIASGNEMTELKAFIINNNSSDWVKVTYKTSDGSKSLMLTSDHPLPIYNESDVEEIKHAGSLQLGDKLTRIRLAQPYAEVVKLEKSDKCVKSYDVTTGNEHFNINNDIYSHNCRSQLSVWRLSDHPEWIKKPIEKDDRGYVKAINNKWYNPNKMIKYSRFNIGVTTINIPDVALSAYATKEDVDKDRENGYAIFWKLFDDRLELCHRAIRFRFDYLLGTKAEVAPIQWMNGNFARLGPDDKIDELLKNGFCTASLGYVGLYETVKWLTGESHTQENGRKLGMQIMQFMYDKCQEWKNKEPEHIGYSMYGTPEESTTLKFAKALQRRHGIIEGITDKNYVTNSYHIPVFEGITHGVDAFTKLSKEAPFQDLSSGGNISYVELPAMNKNLKALQAVIKHIYDTNIYAEINTKLDYCQKCGYEGEILLEEQANRPKDYHWKCPNCGNTDTNTMYIVRRVCGYLASMSTGSNQGRLGDIHDREVHL